MEDSRYMTERYPARKAPLRIIAHRGNMAGTSEDENSPRAVDRAIAKGYDVEIDVRVNYCGTFSLGHDRGVYTVAADWLLSRSTYLWCHAKNPEALYALTEMGMRCFGHDVDRVVLTSSGHLWTYPNRKTVLTPSSILVMPENMETPSGTGLHLAHLVPYAFGVCTDYCDDWRAEYPLC